MSSTYNFKAKNSYSIEHRLMVYVPTAFYGAVVVFSYEVMQFQSAAAIDWKFYQFRESDSP
jgi:hypothetical protein